MSALPTVSRTLSPILLAASVALAALVGPGAGPAAAQSVRLHVRVETQGGTGEQVSRFWAFTSQDEAGTQRVPVSRLCVTGVGHESRERCVTDADQVEVEERVTGLAGVGNRCVEALATALWGAVPINASARACP
jgi:hypothetical protein